MCQGDTSIVSRHFFCTWMAKNRDWNGRGACFLFMFGCIILFHQTRILWADFKADFKETRLKHPNLEGWPATGEAKCGTW